MTELITIAEAARRLGLHVSTVRAWVRRGLIPSLRSGARFVRLDWDAVLDALRRSDQYEDRGSEGGRSCRG